MGENNDKMQNTLFDSNGENTEMLKAKAMNRDYLHAIYGAELEPLNREVRYTRTAYLKELIDAEEACDTKTKKSPPANCNCRGGVRCDASVYRFVFHLIKDFSRIYGD